MAESNMPKTNSITAVNKELHLPFIHNNIEKYEADNSNISASELQEIFSRIYK